jgi:glyoxalase family protein
MTLRPTGMHHVSALTNDIRLNLDFWTRVMGLRLVKKTVNQDEPTMYHLFYADGVGTPGTEMTHFDMPLAAQERAGNNSITRTSFLVRNEDSLAWWQQRLAEHDVLHGDIELIDDRSTLYFEDPHGLPVQLIASDIPTGAQPWAESPVPPEHQLQGLGYSVITVPQLAPTELFLTNALNLEPLRSYPNPDTPGYSIHVYGMDGSGPQSELHVAVRPDLPPARYGSGGVHHLALRIPDFEQYEAWAQRLNDAGLQFNAADRYYFRSLYIREPNGILIELATDDPGFTSDEPLEDLGRSLALPPLLEPQRARIEEALVSLDNR